VVNFIIFADLLMLLNSLFPCTFQSQEKEKAKNIMFEPTQAFVKDSNTDDKVCLHNNIYIYWLVSRNVWLSTWVFQ